MTTPAQVEVARDLAAKLREVERAVRDVRYLLADAQRVGLLPPAIEPVPDLTEREVDVLRLVARGLTNSEIASALHLSKHTVKDHTSTLYRKLEVENRAGAAARALRLGLAA